MEKKEPMIGRRLISMMIDFLLLSIITFFFFGLIVHPLTTKVTNYNEVVATYQQLDKDYSAIQDEYGIYYYDENNKRVENTNVSEEIKQQFLNDERIVTLKDDIIASQQDILKFAIGEVSSSVFLGSLVAFIILPLCLRKGRTLGKMTMKLFVVDTKFNYIKWYVLIPRQLLYIILNIYLGIITLGIMPLVNLVVAILTRENQTIYDLICHSCIADGRIPLEVNKNYTTSE